VAFNEFFLVTVSVVFSETNKYTTNTAPVAATCFGSYYAILRLHKTL